MWLSLVGAILCVAVMFLIDLLTALLTFAAVIALYLIVSYRKPGEFPSKLNRWRSFSINISLPFIRRQLGIDNSSADLQTRVDIGPTTE